jgi:hypothetical protein
VRALYFGTYDRDYPRNAQVISALRRAGVDVIERHVSVWEGRRDNWQAGAATAARLALAEAMLLRRERGDFDVVIVGYPGQLDLRPARRTAAGRPVVFNPLVSLFDTLVDDRGRFHAGSPAARVLRALDVRALRSASLVVADTEAHAGFLAGLASGLGLAFAIAPTEPMLFAFTLGGATAGHLFGRRLRVIRCSACATPIGAGAQSCKKCGAVMRGDIARLAERLEAEERLEDEAS